MRKAPEGWPTWERPVPYGISEAIGAAGMVVAPLLAGFSVTLIVLTLELISPGATTTSNDLAPPDPILLPNLALALLVAATVTLLAAVQCAFWARQYQATPGEIEQWWGGLDDSSTEIDKSIWKEARREQFGFNALQKRWISRFRHSYHCGILLVLAALVVLLIPAGTISAGRWVTIGLAAAGALGEIAWIVATALDSKWEHRYPPNPRLWRRAVRWMVPPFVRGEPGDLAPTKRPS